MTYDVDAIRACFPALAGGTAFFDGPGGSQTPTAVADAIRSALLAPLANRGTTTQAARNAEALVVACREALGDLVNADPDEVIFGRSMTALTFDLSRALAARWQPGDEVVVTRLDHDANVRPWVIAAKAAGAEVKWVDFDPHTSELPVANVAARLSERTRLVAVTAASNLIGTRPNIAAIAERVHACGALLFVDGVHYTAHDAVDVHGLGADFFACSPYKFLGPHCAMLAAAPELLETITPDKLAPSTNVVPERFEFGTLPYEIMAGVTAAIDFLAGIAPGSATGRRERLRASLHEIDAHELRLRQTLEAGLASFGDDVILWSRAADRTPTLSLTMPGRRTEDAYRFLAARDVLAPSSDFYAYEAFRALGTDDTGALRLGVAPYTDDRDVERALDGIGAFLRG